MKDYVMELEHIENSLVDRVDGKKLMDYTSNIAKWVRISGTQEEVDSLLYCEKVMKEIGYETKLTFHDAFISVPVRAHVEMVSPVPMGFRALTHCFTRSAPEHGLEGGAVDSDSPDINGLIAIKDGLPNADQVRDMEKRGAVAVIYVQDDNLHNSPVSSLWGGPTEKTEGLLPGIPVVSVVRQDGAFIRDQMKKGPVKIWIQSVVDTGWRKVPLLEAQLKAEGTEDFLLFGSHIDSWDYGAMDNGAANATMIECARLLAAEQKSWKRGLRLVFWAGHSQGKFFSSAWYADNHFEELEKHCAGYVYVDSTGGKDAVVIDEAPVMPQTRSLAASVIKKQTGIEFIGKRIGHFADQSFYGVGLTSICGTLSEQDIEKTRDILSFRTGTPKHAGGLGWWWHTEHDTMDIIDRDILIRDTKIYVAVVWRLLSSAVLPYDFREAVEEMKETVESLGSLLGDRFDFMPLRERLCLLERRMGNLYRQIEGNEIPDEDADSVNALLQKLSHKIVRITFHGENHFDFDLSGAMYPIPSLGDGVRLAGCNKDSYRYFVLRTQLMRGYNRVMSYVREAAELLAGYDDIDGER